MTSPPNFLPWQYETAQAWLARRERFAHAWLVHGLHGIGKRQFTLAAAASLLCENPNKGLACQQCAACHWVAIGNHPDLRLIRPDAVALEEGAEASDDTGDAAVSGAKKAPSKEIRVQQLRDLTHWFNTATHRGGWRVAVLYPADALNSISANALLKVLEEPPEHTVFLLVGDAPDRLLPTLVSRCRRVPLPVPSQGESTHWLAAQGLDNAGQWLAAAGGAPLRALELAQGGDSACPDWLIQFVAPLASGRMPDISLLADMLEKRSPALWIDNLQRLFVDLLLAASGAPVRYFPGMAQNIEVVARAAALFGLADTSRWLAQQRAIATHPLNIKLLAHSTLQRVAGACSQVRR